MSQSIAEKCSKKPEFCNILRRLMSTTYKILSKKSKNSRFFLMRFCCFLILMVKKGKNFQFNWPKANWLASKTNKD
ncbi:MAG: hypothetical protein CVT92_11375 [Bacteroidetes bacterium HGW-Bacteroidetes-1]|nr:MAG: hypothetical protein CVT92_11375 [Bacteroidetes bacterium HGW-Bacteroidetes-1]